MDRANHQDLIAACPEVCLTCSAKRASICDALPVMDLGALADCASLKAFANGEALVSEGTHASHVFNIVEGMAMMTSLMADGRRQVQGFLFKGDFFGLIQGALYGVSIHALTPVRVCRFPTEPFKRVLLTSPMIEHELLVRASNELIAARAHITLLGCKTAIERVTGFLLYINDRQTDLGGASDIAFLPMTRTDIADYLGLTSETVSRAISTLKRRGLIRLLDHGAVRLLRAHASLTASKETLDVSLQSCVSENFDRIGVRPSL